MPALGSGNPIPFKIGGGPSDTEIANKSIIKAVGVGGSSPDGTIRAQWFLARARGLAAIYADNRALNQYFPDTSNDFLQVFEEILGTFASPDDSEQDRRDKVTLLWTLIYSSVTEDLEAALQEVNENISIVEVDRDETTITQLGRAFQDINPADPDASGPPFNIGKQTNFPNYSTEFICYVNYGVAGTPTATDFRNIEDAKAILRDRLPSWVGFEIFKGIGFFLDIDLLDLGVFGNYPAGTIYPP